MNLPRHPGIDLPEKSQPIVQFKMKPRGSLPLHDCEDLMVHQIAQKIKRNVRHKGTIPSAKKHKTLRVGIQNPVGRPKNAKPVAPNSQSILNFISIKDHKDTSNWPMIPCLNTLL